MDYSNQYCDRTQYLCDICDQVFFEIVNFTIHHIHEHGHQKDQISYDCANCYQSFTDQFHFEKHVVSSSFQLDEIFSKENTSNSHTSAIDDIHEGVKYYCESCGKMFERQDRLNEHIYLDHESSLNHQAVINQLRQIYFNLQKVLNSRKIEEVNCQRLLKSATTHSENDIDMISNTKEIARGEGTLEKNPNDTSKTIDNTRDIKKCDSCGKALTQTNHLRTHIKTSYKNLKCDPCDESLNLDSDLRKHIKTIHKGCKDFQCDSCGKSFTRTDSLRTHIKTIHEDRIEFKCESCGKSFPRTHSLKTHIKTIHEGRIDFKNIPNTRKSFGKSIICKGCKNTFQDDIWRHLENIENKICMNKYTKLQIERLKDYLKIDETECKGCKQRFKYILMHLKRQSYQEKESPCIDKYSDMDLKNLKEIAFKRRMKVNGYHRLNNPNIRYQKSKFQKAKCDICKKLFNQQWLEKHIKIVHEGIKNSKCNQCEVSFGTSGELRIHISKMHGGKNYPCELCKSIFYSKQKLQNHKRAVHEGRKGYLPCEICGKKFEYLSKLKMHIQVIHLNKKENVQCESCGNNYTKYTLKQHIDRVHGEKKYICELCAKKFALKRLLEKHVTQNTCTIIKEKITPKCTTCGKIFTKTGYLNKHKKIIHNGYRYSCETYGKSYTVKFALDHHIALVHNGIKKYHCTSCSKQYAKKSSLQDHINAIHMGFKTNKCQLCNKTFYSNGNLAAHMTLHSGLKDQQCSLCDKSFRTKTILRYHIRRHHS